jgi:hypothetical protein
VFGHRVILSLSPSGAVVLAARGRSVAIRMGRRGAIAQGLPNLPAKFAELAARTIYLRPNTRAMVSTETESDDPTCLR